MTPRKMEAKQFYLLRHFSVWKSWNFSTGWPHACLFGHPFVLPAKLTIFLLLGLENAVICWQKMLPDSPLSLCNSMIILLNLGILSSTYYVTSSVPDSVGYTKIIKHLIAIFPVFKISPNVKQSKVLSVNFLVYID